MTPRDIQHRLGLVLFVAMVLALCYVTYAALEEAARENVEALE